MSADFFGRIRQDYRSGAFRSRFLDLLPVSFPAPDVSFIEGADGCLAVGLGTDEMDSRADLCFYEAFAELEITDEFDIYTVTYEYGSLDEAVRARPLSVNSYRFDVGALGTEWLYADLLRLLRILGEGRLAVESYDRYSRLAADGETLDGRLWKEKFNDRKDKTCRFIKFLPTEEDEALLAVQTDEAFRFISEIKREYADGTFREKFLNALPRQLRVREVEYVPEDGDAIVLIMESRPETELYLVFDDDHATIGAGSLNGTYEIYFDYYTGTEEARYAKFVYRSNCSELGTEGLYALMAGVCTQLADEMVYEEVFKPGAGRIVGRGGETLAEDRGWKPRYERNARLSSRPLRLFE